MTLRVRAETERDRRSVYLMRAAPVISLVAEEGDVVAGHIMFTPVSLALYDGLIMGLAPMAVAPARQYDVPAEVLMALELWPGALRGASGTVRYHAALAEVDA
jgi:predicted N-acetyltransferase YhbS